MAGGSWGLGQGEEPRQQSEEPVRRSEEPIHTLHVYTNLIQIPGLVLSPLRNPMPLVADSRFRLNLDEGPWFKPTHVRLERDDPIALGILLDNRGTQSELMAQMAKALGGLAPQYLHANDHVLMYGLECKLMRATDESATTPEILQHDAEVLLHPGSGETKKKKGKKECVKPTHLVDSLVMMTTELRSRAGRRMILAVTDGKDQGSVRTWKEMTTYAQGQGVTIFVISANVDEFGRMRARFGGNEDPMRSASELSGGLVMTSDRRGLMDQLRAFRKLMRGRYILEFPRARNSTAGEHAISVKVEKSDAFIRVAGVSVALPDAKELSDPTTIRNDESQTPEMGGRRPLSAGTPMGTPAAAPK